VPDILTMSAGNAALRERWLWRREVGKSSSCMGYRTAVSAILSIWWWSIDGNFINGKLQNDEDSKSLVQWLVVQLCCWLEARVRCLYVSTSWRKPHYISSLGFSFLLPFFILHPPTNHSRTAVSWTYFSTWQLDFPLIPF